MTCYRSNLSFKVSFILKILKYFLGIEVVGSKKSIFNTHMKYVLDSLSETRKLMIHNLQLTKDGEPFKDHGRYRRLVGKLDYLTDTLLDIVNW